MTTDKELEDINKQIKAWEDMIQWRMIKIKGLEDEVKTIKLRIKLLKKENK